MFPVSIEDSYGNKLVAELMTSPNRARIDNLVELRIEASETEAENSPERMKDQVLWVASLEEFEDMILGVRKARNRYLIEEKEAIDALLAPR